jgi:hypothetical protein
MIRLPASVLCLVLGIAGQAAAGPAWVLWEYWTYHGEGAGGPKYERWLIRSAWPDWQPCKAAEEVMILERVAMKPAGADARTNRTGNTVTAQVGNHTVWSSQIVCLPDTILDPRTQGDEVSVAGMATQALQGGEARAVEVGELIEVAVREFQQRHPA